MAYLHTFAETEWSQLARHEFPEGIYWDRADAPKYGKGDSEKGPGGRVRLNIAIHIIEDLPAGQYDPEESPYQRIDGVLVNCHKQKRLITKKEMTDLRRQARNIVQPLPLLPLSEQNSQVIGWAQRALEEYLPHLLACQGGWLSRELLASVLFNRAKEKDDDDEDDDDEGNNDKGSGGSKGSKARQNKRKVEDEEGVVGNGVSIMLSYSYILEHYH
jgi:hypothetical protein